MKITTVAMAAMALMLTGTADAAPKKDLPLFVNYNVFDGVDSPDDRRDIITQISVSGDAYADYGYSEHVHGATTPTVRALNFRNRVAAVTPAQQAALVAALTEAGLFTLKDEGQSYQSDYNVSLRVRTGDRTVHLRFHTLPTEGSRLAVHKVLLDFAHQLDIDRPREPGAETISEGDLMPAKTVDMAELIAHTAAYDGKRIRITGYFKGGFEASTVCVDKTATDTRTYGKCIWRGARSSFAGKLEINDSQDGWTTMDGVFFKGPAGHLGLWPGEIARVTLSETAPGKP